MFNQNLIAMRAETWKKMLDYRYQDDNWKNLKKWSYKIVGKNRVRPQLTEGFEWFLDQKITTMLMLKKKLCSLPKLLHKALKVDREKITFDDTNVSIYILFQYISLQL